MSAIPFAGTYLILPSNIQEEQEQSAWYLLQSRSHKVQAFLRSLTVNISPWNLC